MASLEVPFNKPALVGNEVNYIAQAVASGHISGDGSFTKKCNAVLEGSIGAARALLTTSCTHALEMAALLLDIQPGDEVIVPSFTFVSTINAFVLRGAIPVFIDIRPDTLNLDESKLESLITPRTKAVLPVHYAGVGCEMDAIMGTAGRYGLLVVEDNAHGLFGKYRGKYLGTFGCMSTLSFHETKNFTCGEGGALIINQLDYVERAEIVREKGTNRSRFFRGQVDKYTWVDIGSSFLPSDVLAAYLYAQLEMREWVQSQRRRVWEYYKTHLAEWAAASAVGLPVVPPHCEQAYHTFYLILPSPEARSELIHHLRSRGVASAFHYVPLHLSEMGSRFGGFPGQCPVTEDISERQLRLPFFNALTEAQLATVVAAVTEYRVPSLRSQSPAGMTGKGIVVQC